MRLVIGNKNYSSWSLRPWLLLKQLDIPFEEEVVSLAAPDFKIRVTSHAPTGKVPVLVDDGFAIWDSLAIAEYVSDKHPEAAVWPAALQARARARSVCAEMHAGFQALRSALPMNCTARFPRLLPRRPVAREVARIVELWADCRARFGAGGPFLFGAFSAADAFFAPVTSRFLTYDIDLPAAAGSYVETIDALPAMKEWIAAARNERDFLDDDEHEPYRTRP